jgi:hypothetical protein
MRRRNEQVGGQADTLRGHRGRVALLSVVILTVGLATSLAPRTGSEIGLASPARATSAVPVPVRPVTKANTGSGTGAPPDPAANIAPSPNFLTSCSGVAYDNSAGCENAVLAAIANARNQEGLPAMVLPADWTQLTPQQQLFAATNLERTARGLPALSGMATVLDQTAQAAAAQNADPAAPAGFPWTSWGGNWAGAVGSPLEAIYFWMYDDGQGSYNIDCTPTNASGCWGHRNNILMSLHCTPCVMGTGFNATAYEGHPSWTELLVDTSGSPALDFPWSQVVANLPGTPGGAALTAKAVGIASTADGQGYWLVASDGGVFAFGTAPFYGSMGGRHLAAPIVGIASTPDGHGYWLVASDGGLFAFGDAGFHGSMGGHPLAKPVVGMAPTPDGGGYWEVASDGGVFAFGDAPYLGSMGGTALFRPVVAMAATPDGHGYWMTASDGGIFAFGDAPFRGSTGGEALAAPIVSMAPSSTVGYWLAAADGGIFSFGVPFHGSMG